MLVTKEYVCNIKIYTRNAKHNNQIVFSVIIIIIIYLFICLFTYLFYNRLPITRTFRGNRKRFELSQVRVIEGKVI